MPRKANIKRFGRSQNSGGTEVGPIVKALGTQEEAMVSHTYKLGTDTRESVASDRMSVTGPQNPGHETQRCKLCTCHANHGNSTILPTRIANTNNP